MSAEPPLITWPEAQALGLLQEREVAACLGLSRAQLRERVAAGEVAAVAQMKNPRNGHRHLLFAFDGLNGQRQRQRPIHEVAASVENPDTPYRSRPPRRVGTRTTRASRYYQWRDPARWREPQESA